MLSAAALWGLWKLRNRICFQGLAWKDMRSVQFRINIAVLIQGRALLCPQMKKTEFSMRLEELKLLATRPTR
jgi:hypothetical protein